jgi:LL-diaminopimelate aminotransferase
MPVRAERLQNLPPYVFAVISQRIRQMHQKGLDVIRLDIGSPDLPPHQMVIDALSQSANNPNNHGYSGYTGTPAFREAVARYYQRRFDVELNPDTEVLPLLGSKEGIVNLSLAYLGHGDISLVPDIGYPAYGMGARLAGADIYEMHLSPDNDFLPKLNTIPEKIRQQAKLLWVNYPNNPTGAVASLDFYNTVVEFCADHDVLLASDNPYCDITYDDYTAPSALQADSAKAHTIEFMSMSKTFNMAGWRLGAAVGSADALKNLLRVKSNVDSGHFKAIYDAGIVALDNVSDDWQEERNCVYQRRRDQLIAALPDIGLEAYSPKATLYVWAKTIDGTAPETYIEQALSEAQVSIAPGAAYGSGGTDYLRLSLTVPDDRLEEGIKRLKAWYAAR